MMTSFQEFLRQKVDITLAPKKLIRTRRASEGSASEPSLARRVSMCKDAKLSCRGNSVDPKAAKGRLDLYLQRLAELEAAGEMSEAK